jgi:hypothetical protein
VGRAGKGAIVGLMLGAGVIASPAALATKSSSRRSITVQPRVGIAGVRLNETPRAVRRLLGKGHYLRRGEWSGSYSYRSGSITVLVSYGSGLVDGVDTQSRSALIYGRPLSQGLAKLRPVFRAHGWSILSCQGETYTDLGQGAPGTGIAWRAGKLDYVQIDAGGSIGDACLPP